MMKSNRKAERRGSALLICTLATAVLSMAAIAILRSSQRSIARVGALRSSSQGRCVSEGLYQRSIAMLRTNPNVAGTIVDPANGIPDARCELHQLSPTATQIQVFLYAGSSIPAIDTVVDPTALQNAGGGGPAGTGPPADTGPPAGTGPPSGKGPPAGAGAKGRGPGGLGAPGRTR